MTAVLARLFLILPLFTMGFSVWDNDICPPLLDVAFLLDASGSIEEIYSEQVRWTAALSDILPIHPDAVRVAAIQYAGYPLTEFGLNTYSDRDDVVRHLQEMSFQSGVTRTGYALRRAEDELFEEDRGGRTTASKVIVLFTDGLSIDDPLKPSEYLRRRKGVKMYVVSVSADGFLPEMQRIAGDSSNVYRPGDLQLLKERLLKDVEEARVCEGDITGNVSSSEGITAAVLSHSTDLANLPIIEMSAETLKTSAVPSFPSSPDFSTVIHDNEVKARAALHSAEARTTPMSPNEIFERVLHTVETAYPNSVLTDIPSTSTQQNHEVKLLNSRRTTISTANSQRRRKKIRRVLRRKLKRGNGLPHVDSSGSTTRNKVRRIIRKTKTRKIVSRTSSGSARPPVVHSSPTAAFPQLLKSTELQPLKETIQKDTHSKHDNYAHPPVQTPVRTTTEIMETFTKFPEAKVLRPATRTRSTIPVDRPRAASRAFSSKTFAGNEIPTPKCALDVLFVVDSSGSVGDIYEKQKEFLSELLLSIQPENQSHRVALIQFAGAKLQKTEWLFDSFHKSTELIKAFNGVRHFTGTTYIGAALELAQQLLEKRRPNVKTVVVLLSDGFSQDDATRPADAIRAMKNVELYAVSLSKLSNRNYLHQLVEDDRKMAVENETNYLRSHLISTFFCNK